MAKRQMAKRQMAKQKRMKQEKAKAHQDKSINDKLAKKHACYVLVTCEEPLNGDMQVEMTYHGDTSLAAMLLHGAQTYMDEKYDHTEDD